MAGFIAVLGNAEGFRWVLRREAIAFAAGAALRASHVAPGDSLLVYLTPPCRSGLGDRGATTGLLVGSAVVLTTARYWEPAPLIAGRRYPIGCQLLFERLAPLGQGVPLKSMVGKVHVLGSGRSWGQSLRRSPVLLGEQDARILEAELAVAARPFDEVVSAYLGG